MYGIPTDRDLPNEVVVQRAAESLKNLELMVHRTREVVILVAVDTQREAHRAGYLILELTRVEETTGESQSHVYDVAVEQHYMGRYVAHRLVREAARVSHQRGLRFMSANVTAANERALLTALRMGFQIERYSLILACGPEGVEKMPTRPADQRGHEANRLERRLQRQRRLKPVDPEDRT